MVDGDPAPPSLAYIGDVTIMRYINLHFTYLLSITHPSDHSYLCLLKCHLVFTSRRNACIASAVLATAIPSVCLSVLGFIHVYSHASILHVIFPFIKLLNIMLFYSVI